MAGIWSHLASLYEGERAKIGQAAANLAAAEPARSPVPIKRESKPKIKFRNSNSQFSGFQRSTFQVNAFDERHLNFTGEGAAHDNVGTT